MIKKRIFAKSDNKHIEMNKRSAAESMSRSFFFTLFHALCTFRVLDNFEILSN